MKTVSVNLSSLSVPCENRCRYCLLSWDGNCLGTSYEDCRAYAEGLRAWLRENRPDLRFEFYFGYSMEHPNLLKTVDYMHENGYVQGDFLQFDGMKFRTPGESLQLLTDLKDHGIRMVDFTFYGTRDYHDRFAGRAGDFDYMVRLLAQAQKIGLNTEVGIPLTHENAPQAEELIQSLLPYEPQRIFCFVPHGEGRGVHLDKIRFSQADFEYLPPLVREHFNRSLYRPEGEWVTGGFFQAYQKRVLALVPTPENLEHFRSLGYEGTLAYLERLDDDYHRALPANEELIKLYADPQGQEFYSQRDLIMHVQRRYIAENRLDLYDIHDERHSFVRRF